MNQRLNVITIGADNLPGMVNFYVEKLGWKSVAGDIGIVCFKVNGFLISIMQRQLFNNFIGTESKKKGSNSFILGFNVDTKEEVISYYETLKRKNVRIVTEPVEPSLGACFFYFADIEGNIFEVACNPYIVMDEKGNISSYKPFE